VSLELILIFNLICQLSFYLDDFYKMIANEDHKEKHFYHFYDAHNSKMLVHSCNKYILKYHLSKSVNPHKKLTFYTLLYLK